MGRFEKLAKYLFMGFIVVAVIFAYNEYTKKEKRAELDRMRESVERGEREIEALESFLEVLE
jgi:hypothetical protein